jgi:hypothetical protein
MDARAVRFAEVGRVLTSTARAGGLVAPTFRSPPRVLHVDRTLRRRDGAAPAVAVRLGERPFPAVVADMVEGVIVANGVTERDAAQWRRRLWTAVESVSGTVADAA